MAKPSPRAKLLTAVALLYAAIVAIGMYNTGTSLTESLVQGAPIIIFGALLLGFFLFALLYLTDIFLELLKDVVSSLIFLIAPRETSKRWNGWLQTKYDSFVNRVSGSDKEP